MVEESVSAYKHKVSFIKISNVFQHNSEGFIRQKIKQSLLIRISSKTLYLKRIYDQLFNQQNLV